MNVDEFKLRETMSKYCAISDDETVVKSSMRPRYVNTNYTLTFGGMIVLNVAGFGHDLLRPCCVVIMDHVNTGYFMS
jgi:hypothetical protein